MVSPSTASSMARLIERQGLPFVPQPSASMPFTATKRLPAKAAEVASVRTRTMTSGTIGKRRMVIGLQEAAVWPSSTAATLRSASVRRSGGRLDELVVGADPAVGRQQQNLDADRDDGAVAPCHVPHEADRVV